MGGAAVMTVAWTRGSVEYLVVLYSITVFITFVLSQAGNALVHRNATPAADWFSLPASQVVIVGVRVEI